MKRIMKREFCREKIFNVIDRRDLLIRQRASEL